MKKTFLISLWRTYENIRKIATVQEDDYTNDCSVGYDYFKKYKMIAIDLGEQQAIDADPKAIQHQFYCKSRKYFMNIFHYLRSERNYILDFPQGTVKVLQFYFVLI